MVVDVLGLGPLGDDGEHAAGGEAVDGPHLEQRAGFHLEAQHAEPVVLVDHAAHPPQQVRVGGGVRALLALEERIRRCDDTYVPLDAELVGDTRQRDREERVGDGGELRRRDVVGRALVGQRARSDDDRSRPHLLTDRS